MMVVCLCKLLQLMSNHKSSRSLIPNQTFSQIDIVIYFHRGVTQQVDVLDEKNSEKILNNNSINRKNILTGDHKGNICNLRGYEYCF